MKSLFKSEQEANEYKEKHQLLGRVAEPVQGTGRWALNFPIAAHVSVATTAIADIVEVQQPIPRPRFG